MSRLHLKVECCQKVISLSEVWHIMQISDLCAICGKTLRRGDVLRLLPCRHVLHSECTRPMYEVSEIIHCPVSMHRSYRKRGLPKRTMPKRLRETESFHVLWNAAVEEKIGKFWPSISEWNIKLRIRGCDLGRWRAKSEEVLDQRSSLQNKWLSSWSGSSRIALWVSYR